MKKIKKYLNNQLSELEDEQITKTLIVNHFDRQLEQKWTKILADKHQLKLPPKQVRKNNFTIYRKIASIAASIAVLLMAIPAYQSFMQPSSQEMIASLYTTDNKKAIMTIKKSANEAKDIDATKIEAENAYNSNNFEQAIIYYTQITKAPSSLIDEHFYLGLSYFYNAQYKEAVAALSHANTLKTHDNFQSKEDINWYLGLAYLQTQQIELAKPILEHIAAKSHTKKRKALAIQLLKLQ